MGCERAREAGPRETKTRHCQALRHRNRHPPRETLNHFYCIELSLLAPGRERLNAPAPLVAPPPPAPPAAPADAILLFQPGPGESFLSTRLERASAAQIMRPRKHSHPFGCPNGITSLIREFTREGRRPPLLFLAALPLSPLDISRGCPSRRPKIFLNPPFISHYFYSKN